MTTLYTFDILLPFNCSKLRHIGCDHLGELFNIKTGFIFAQATQYISNVAQYNVINITVRVCVCVCVCVCVRAYTRHADLQPYTFHLKHA